MGLYADHLLPRMIDRALRRPAMMAERALATPGLHGRVLEVGFGSGLNLPVYPPEVEHVWALDPAPLGQKLARKRVAAFHGTVEFLPFDRERIPLPDGSADGVLSTWTLCSIPELERALGELRRVLRPEGRFHFLEHGLAPEPRVARWQRRLNPLQKRLAGGCRLDLDVDAALERGGFAIETLERHYAEGPRFASYLYRGIARPGPSNGG